MASLTELERERDQAFKKSQEIKSKLKDSLENPLLLARLAQEANDAWLEFKKKEIEFNNQVVFKRIGDLYGG